MRAWAQLKKLKNPDLYLILTSIEGDFQISSS
jgi:hypothetical protein